MKIERATDVFNSKIPDAILYLFFYGVIPVSVTCISLKMFPADTASGVYCYVTILISALNCLYDGMNRFDTSVKSRRNAKIFAICTINGIIAAYCLYVVLGMLITKDSSCRYDVFLLSYLLVVLIALWDTCTIFSKYVTLKEAVGGGKA